MEEPRAAEPSLRSSGKEEETATNLPQSMSAFFGLTALGDSKCFETSLDSETERLGQVPFERFIQAFDANCIGDCKLARDLQVDGTQVMLRSKLFELAEDVVGKPLDRHDHDLFRMYDRHSIAHTRLLKMLQQFGAIRV